MRDSGQLRLGVIRAHLRMDPFVKRKVFLIGSCIRDIQAWVSPGEQMASGGSSPGRVTYSAGGVAFNIARALSALSRCILKDIRCEIDLISVVGKDDAGNELVKLCHDSSISTEGIRRIGNGSRTATVVIIFDASGNVAYSVADVDIVERFLTPDVVSTCIHQPLGSGDILVLDGDLEQASILRACEHASSSGCRILFEPTSVSKASRCIPALKYIDYMTPNVEELASILSGLCQHTPDTFPKSCRRTQCITTENKKINIPSAFVRLASGAAAILRAGIGHVLVTAGDQGAALFSGPEGNTIQCIYCPPIPADVVSVSGAGDCLAAGFILGLVMEEAPRQALAMGVASAWEALQTESNVPLGLEEKRFKTNIHGILPRVRESHIDIPCSCMRCCNCV